MADVSLAPARAAVGMMRLCRADAVPEEGGLQVVLPGRSPVAVFRSGSEFFVTDDECTHGNASLAEGTVIDDEIECPFHLGRFCLRTGAVTRSPCTDPLRTYSTEVRGEYVYAALV